MAKEWISSVLFLPNMPHSTSQFQSICPPPRYPLPLPTQGWVCVHEGQGRRSRFQSYLSGDKPRTQNQGSCCSSLLQRKSLFSIRLKEKHLVRKVLNRGFFLFPLLSCHFAFLLILSACVHPWQKMHIYISKARIFRQTGFLGMEPMGEEKLHVTPNSKLPHHCVFTDPPCSATPETDIEDNHVVQLLLKSPT